MAVYTKVEKNILEKFLKNYDLGNLLSFEEVQEGVENSNFKIITSKGKYILTIFEKRVNNKDLPFFIGLTQHLHKKNFLCPKPLSNNIGSYINKIKNKSCVINTFIKGTKAISINKNHCKQLGKQLAIMHITTGDFKLNRKNNLSKKQWTMLFKKLKKNNNSKYKDLFNKISFEINYLEKNWPKSLPSGIIHADAFPDNVFFLRFLVAQKTTKSIFRAPTDFSST